MWLPPESKFKWVEVGKYIKSLDRLIREQKDGEPVWYQCDDLNQWVWDNENIGLYTSIFQYDQPSLDGLRVANLYFDLDCKEDPVRALWDARYLVKYLLQYISEDAIRIYFTGEKGFHIEVEAAALGLGPARQEHKVYRFIAESLAEELDATTYDFVIYEPRRLWRMRNSIHQKTQLFKVPLVKEDLLGDLDSLRKLAARPRSLKIPDQRFEPKANEWYKQWSVRMDERIQQELEERIALFQKRGTELSEDSKHGVQNILMYLETKTEPGKRNNVLNWSSFQLGKLVAQGLINYEQISEELLRISQFIGLQEGEARATIKSGLAAGIAAGH